MLGIILNYKHASDLINNAAITSLPPYKNFVLEISYRKSTYSSVSHSSSKTTNIIKIDVVPLVNGVHN